MMNILVAGNSQAGILRRALFDKLVSIDDFKVSFYVIPGGTGPAFALRGGKLALRAFNPKHPPYTDPTGIADTPVSEYDAVVISALGYVDGGFAFRNPISCQGLLAEFGPKANALTDALISQACLREVVRDGLSAQSGFTFLRDLRENYSGRIVVQPFPYLSDYVKSRSDWMIRSLYEDYLGFNRFLADARNSALSAICEENGAELLDYPDSSYRETRFTPRHLMSDSDGVHPRPEYGSAVMRQIADCLRSPPNIPGRQQ